MINEYRKSSHSVFSIQLHLSWITKYRYKILKGDIGQRTKDISSFLFIQVFQLAN